MNYPQGIGSKFAIQGKLKPFQMSGCLLSVKVYRIGVRRKYVDEAGQIWLKADGLWWKYPEEVSF